MMLTESLSLADAEPSFNADATSPAELENMRLRFVSQCRSISFNQHKGIARVAHLIAQSLRIPIVSICLAEEDGPRRVTAIGLPTSAPAALMAFMTAARECGRTLVIPDIAKDGRFDDHPYVKSSPFVGSAICVPLFHQRGWFLGFIGAWDTSPRVFTAREIGLINSLAEIAAGELEAHSLMELTRSQARLLKGIFENAAVGISVSRLDRQPISINARYAEMLGYEVAELYGALLWDLVHSDDRGAGQASLQQLLSGKISSYQREVRYIRKDGSSIWLRDFVSLMKSPDQSEPFVITIMEDIHERMQAQEARNLLLGEINHRVKNTLAIVQGIAKQLLRSANSTSDFATAFETRVQALAKSHDMLTEASWRPLPLDQIVEHMLQDSWEPYASQVRFSGPRVDLNAQTTVMLGLLLHELMTNAIKHGALGTPAGSIDIEGAVEPRPQHDWLRLCWREDAGRSINPPSRKGLGSYLIERGAKLGLGGEGSIEFSPRGVRCDLAFPIYRNTGMSLADSSC